MSTTSNKENTIVTPCVDGLYYTKARSGLILAYSYEGRVYNNNNQKEERLYKCKVEPYNLIMSITYQGLMSIRA
ncbi:hypothetical protein LXL04_029223 [Taraxacum kok-saghyz]